MEETAHRLLKAAPSLILRVPQIIKDEKDNEREGHKENATAAAEVRERIRKAERKEWNLLIDEFMREPNEHRARPPPLLQHEPPTPIPQHELPPPGKTPLLNPTGKHGP